MKQVGVKKMHNLWLEFLVEKFVEEETNIRCCGSCQGGCLNPAVCAFVCCQVPIENFYMWYSDNKDRLRSEWEYKNQLEEEAYIKTMEETNNVDL